MRVRVWISGAEGPSRDFELVAAPRVGDAVSISVAGRFEEGIVSSVVWQLVGIEAARDDLVIGVEPVGSVTMVHVICRPREVGDAGIDSDGVRDLVAEAPSPRLLAPETSG